MRPNIILLVALITVSAGVLAAGCVTPGENVTQPTAPPTEAETLARTPLATETTAPPAGTETPARTPLTTETTAPPAGTETPLATETETATTTTAVTTAGGGGTTTVDLAAEDIAFDTSTITVPAGAEVTVNFDNKDDGIPHNLAVYTDSSADEEIFVGDTVTGPATTTYTFTAPDDPGTYFFRCDVHPQQMTGDFIVQ